jgi:predicted nucleotidyltransferase component of viral defense system
MSKADSIKARIHNLAVKEQKPFDYLLMHYFIERLLYRVSVSLYADDFILKGGLFLYTIFTKEARATNDIDFLVHGITNTLEKIKQIFQEICDIPADDAMFYDANSVTVERIKEDADYEGVRVKLVGYLDKSRHRLQLDIGFGDVVIPKPISMEYPSLLNMNRPIIKAYSKESVIAEKFEAMIYLAEANSRMKDFYDIYTLCQAFDFEGRLLYEAVNQTLERRATPLSGAPVIFSDDFSKIKTKQTQWIAFQNRIGAKTEAEFSRVMEMIKNFLLPIYNCILKEKEFFGHWDHETGLWDTK